MAYRTNVTDKQQSDIESAENDSGIPFYVRRDGAGQKKILPAYALPVNNTAGTPNDIAGVIGGVAGGIGSHNDKPGQWPDPGKA